MLSGFIYIHNELTRTFGKVPAIERTCIEASSAWTSRTSRHTLSLSGTRPVVAPPAAGIRLAGRARREEATPLSSSFRGTTTTVAGRPLAALTVRKARRISVFVHALRLVLAPYAIRFCAISARVELHARTPARALHSQSLRLYRTVRNFYVANLRQFSASIGCARPRPYAVRVAGTSVTRVQLQTLVARVRLALFEISDGRRRINGPRAHLMRTILAAPDALVGCLNASGAVGEQFAEFLVGRHAPRWRLVDALHVHSVVNVVVLKLVARYTRYLQASLFSLVPNALDACSRDQTLVLHREMLANAWCVAQHVRQHLSVETAVDVHRFFENRRTVTVPWKIGYFSWHRKLVPRIAGNVVGYGVSRVTTGALRLERVVVCVSTEHKHHTARHEDTGVKETCRRRGCQQSPFSIIRMIGVYPIGQYLRTLSLEDVTTVNVYVIRQRIVG